MSRPDRAWPRLVAYDLDGTMITAGGELSDAAVGALRAARDAGIRRALVTGRPARHLLELPRLAKVCDGAVCSNGAVILDVASGQVLEQHGFSSAEVEAAAAALRAGLPGCRLAVITDDGFAREPGYRPDWHAPDERVLAPAELVRQPVLKILVQDLRHDKVALTRLCAAALGGRANVVYGIQDTFVEVTPPGVDKAFGLARLAARWNIDGPGTVAIGDMPGDLPMLRWAGRAVAVVTAAPEVLAAADEVIPGPEADGPAQYVRQLVAGLAAADRIRWDAQTSMELASAAEVPEPGALALPLLPEQADRFSSNAWEEEQGLDLPPFNLARVVRVDGELHVQALEAALRSLAARHDALRVAFPQGGEAGYQVVYPPDRSLALEHHDVSSLPAAEREPAALGLLDHAASRRFDLEAGMLARAVAVDLGGGSHLVMLVTEHITVDGISFEILLSDLWEMYRAELSGAPPPDGGGPGYAEHVAAEVRRLAQLDIEDEAEHWRKRLDGMGVAPPLVLPGAKRATNGEFLGDMVHAAVDPEHVPRLWAIAGRAPATPFGLLLAAYGAVVYRFSGVDDLGCYVPVARRTTPDTLQLVGLLSSHTLVRQDVGGDPAFTELLRRTQEAVLDAYDHASVPFGEIARRLEPETAGRHREVPGLWCDLVRWTPRTSIELPGASVGMDVGIRRDFVAELLGLNGAYRQNGLELSLGYPRDVYDREPMQGLLDYLCAFLAAAATRPDDPLSSLLAEADEKLAGCALPG